MKQIKLFLFALTALCVTMPAMSQNGIQTPYSRFGYGILRDNATASQQSMGGIGYAMNSGRQINVMNPASYARIDSLTFLFDMGADLTSIWSEEPSTGLSENNIGAGLNYITMQFPLGKRMGMSVGLLPYSSVGYSFGNTIENGYTTRSGSGSINELYVGVAGRIVSTLTIGVNISYLFGSTINDTYAITKSASTSLYENELKVRDFHIDAGIQYTLPIGHTDALTLGFVYSPAKALLGHFKSVAYDIDNSSTQYIAEFGTKNYFGLAATYGAGINYNHDKRLMLEADFTYQPWEREKYLQYEDDQPVAVTGVFSNRWKVAVGAQFQPALRGSYGRRIQYRAGMYFTHDYMNVRESATSGLNNVREYGASVGVGLPVPGFKSIISVGLGWMQRRAFPIALIRENYLNLTVGINFNEAWFRKSRIY